MKIDLFDINRFVELNHVMQVTDPVLFSNQLPTPKGIFSYEIFGYSELERKNKFGYIDLNGHFIHPLIYSMLSARMGSIKAIISGEKYGKIVNNKIVVVNNEADGDGTGISFIYTNFDKINWLNEIEESEINSIDKKTRLQFLKSIKKNEFFVDKWLVLPAHYREERDTSNVGDNINSLYKDLISATRALKSSMSFDLFANSAKMRVQNLLLELYLTTINVISGKTIDPQTKQATGQSKNSLLSRNILAKNIDYAANTVISAPVISDTESASKMPVPFGYALLPLETSVSLFQPFFAHEIVTILDQCIKTLQTDVYNQTNKEYSVVLNQFTPNDIDKLITRFIKSEAERFDPVEFALTRNNGTKSSDGESVISFYIKEYKTKADADVDRNFVERPLTYCDLFYQAALSVLKNKCVLITRHPVTNIKNIYPAMVLVNSTAHTRKIYMHNLNPELYKSDVIEYESYPYIDYPNNTERKPAPYYNWVGTTIIGNAVLKKLGGDYDGDMVFIRGLYSLEANDEARAKIYAKNNVFDADGLLARRISFIGKDAVVALYELTKE